MVQRSSDSIVQQKSSKKSRELKDLGPTLEELVYGREPDGTRSRLGFWMSPEEAEAMRQRRQTHSSDDRSYTRSPEEEARYRRQNREYAEAGLQYYNKKNGTNYELVDASNHVTFVYGPVWTHCNFTAKPQMKGDGDMDAESQLFFAEMHYSRSFPKHLVVVTCRLLKGNTKTTTDGCLRCGGRRSVIVHPTNGFRAGHP